MATEKLFCDLKTDEEKSAFFLSGRGFYENGAIATIIQTDVAMAYRRCAEYQKEIEALKAECEKLREIDADRKRREEPVKRARRYAQGTALGEFGIIPMCDQVER